MSLSEGLVHLYIGDGKGKTTAAIGTAVRAAGWGLKVLFCQFLKAMESGEARYFGNGPVTFFRPPMRHKAFIWHQSDKDLNETREDMMNGWLEIKELILIKGYDLVVMDELLDIVKCGFLEESAVLQLIKDKPYQTEMILTGRDASDDIRNASDYITFMKAIKHPYEKGLSARKGIEF